MTPITPRYTQALAYARQVHATQFRKGSGIPYLYHLLAVSSLVLEHGGDEDQAIAGLLHDAIEDGGAHHGAAIRRLFGSGVADIVLDCTDATAEAKQGIDPNDPDARRRDWLERKQRYLDALAHKPDRSLLVSGCDKLHNARAIVQDLGDPAVGAAVFARFTGGREGTLWYYAGIAEVLSARGLPMAPALAEAAARMRAAP